MSKNIAILSKVLFLILSGFAANALAQGTTGSIKGIVSDATGAHEIPRK
jgi:hypothetical protein